MANRSSSAPNIMPLGHSSRSRRALVIPQPHQDVKVDAPEPVTAAEVVAAGGRTQTTALDENSSKVTNTAENTGDKS